MLEFSPYLWLLSAIVAGLLAGSFLGALIARWPEGESIVKGRSRCDACKTILKWYELIPLISFVIQRGKCRNCKAIISSDIVIIELSCALMAMLALVISPNIAGVAGAIFGWVLLTLAIIDLKYLWLPDRLTGFLAVAGLVSGIFVISPNYADRIIGGVAGFLSLYIVALLYRRFRGHEGMGGGDPKLFGAIGCWLGWQYLPFVLLGASLAGLLSVLFAILRGQNISRTSRLSFGSFMAIAAFPVWIWITGLSAL